MSYVQARGGHFENELTIIHEPTTIIFLLTITRPKQEVMCIRLITILSRFQHHGMGVCALPSLKKLLTLLCPAPIERGGDLETPTLINGKLWVDDLNPSYVHTSYLFHYTYKLLQWVVTNRPHLPLPGYSTDN